LRNFGHQLVPVPSSEARTISGSSVCYKREDDIDGVSPSLSGSVENSSANKALLDMPLHSRFSSRVLCRIASVLASALCLLTGGCVAAAGGGTVVASGKTPVDHVISLIAGKNCSIVRQNRGLTYCVEDEVQPALRVYCYPTLGDPTCFGAPDPFPGNQRKLGSVFETAAASH
jgi:hypothetical protein